MRKVAIYLSIFSFFFNTCNNDKSTNAPPKTAGPLTWLATAGNRIVNEQGRSVILRGVNRSGLEYSTTGNGMSQEEIKYIIQNWKAQMIRLPFNQDWLMHDPLYNEFLNIVIDLIAKEGAYVLLDLQWQDTETKIPPIPNKEAVTMWRIIAERYQNNPAVLYDIHNEAHDTSWEQWRTRASEIIEAIQAVHPKAVIFVSGLDWAYDLRGWGANPLPYKNVVYSTHPYPFKGEPWAWDKYFGNYTDKFPVFAGEFGGELKDLDWGQKLLAYFDQKQMGWTAWSWVDQPKLTKDDRRTPTEFGQLVRAALLKHSGK